MTPRGRGLLLGGSLLTVVGLAVGARELAAAGLAGVVAVVLAAVLTARTPSLTVDRQVEPGRVERGGAAFALVTIANSGRLPAVRLSGSDAAGSERLPIAIPRLAAGASHRATVRLPTDRRGPVTVGPLTLARVDPFFLVRRAAVVGGSTELLVHPRVVPLHEGRTSLARVLDGPEADTALEGTLAFHTLREYVLGDDQRHIHWRSSARTGTLMVKQHVDTARPIVAVLLDTRPRKEPEPFEVAVDVVASLGAAALLRGAPLAVLTAGGDLDGAAALGGGAGIGAGADASLLLDALARVQPEPAAPVALAGAVRRLASRGPGSLAVLVTPHPVGEVVAALRPLTGRFATVLAVGCAGGSSAGTRVGAVATLTLTDVGDLPGLLRLVAP